MFNRHTHEWMSNSKGDFCIHCGEFCESKEAKEEHGGLLFGSTFRRSTLMDPNEEITEEKIKEGDRFDPWSR